MPCGLALGAIQQDKPEARPKGNHSPLAMASACAGFWPAYAYPDHPVNPV